MTTVGELNVKVTADTRQLVSKITEESEKSGRGFGKKFAVGLGAAAAGVGAAAAGLGAIVAKQSVDAASNLQETQSKINQVFGPESSAKIQAWAENAATAFGQSSQQAMDAAAGFAIFGKAAGLGGDDLNKFSTDLTVLSSDLASFANTSPEEAITAISAALRGESEPIRKYGVLLDDASLKAEYFAQTGKKVTGTLTPQQRVLAAQALIMKQTADAQGDFARTSDGLANSQRTLTATIEDVKAQIGQGLLPAVTEIVNAVGPMLKDLAPVLGELAKEVGGTLADAFNTIKPLLPPLVQAFGQIASTVGGALISAVATLIPAVMPLLQILANLGQRVGPIVEKVLLKVAELLVAVLDAVVPLLEPLFDLVFTILDAAWPIVEIVAEAFLTLVAAVKPLLGAVIGLLQPLGQLVQVAFAAIMPILKPLLPLIEALAAVLADVLGRAIGLITTAIGYLIIAFSKVAPFVANNLVKPVVSLFLTFAENIVGTAAQAFGWIPGLGDKLNTAKDAISTFKDNATKGIEQAASTISTEGEKIGKGLVDQGLAAMKDPASQNKYSQAGTALGTTASKGLEAGIRSGQVPVQAAATAAGVGVTTAMRQGITSTTSPTVAAAIKTGEQVGAGVAQGVNRSNPAVTAAATNMTNNLTNTAKENLGVKSPSRVFMGIGGFVVQGLQQGIQNAWSTLTTFWSGAVNGLISGAKNILGIASPSKVFITMGGNVAEGFGIGLESIGKVNQDFLDKMDTAVKASEKKIDGWVQATKKQLDDAVQAWKDYRDEVFTSITGDVNFVDAMRKTEDQQKAVQEAQQALSDAQTLAGRPDATQADQDAVTVAQQKLAEAQAAVRTFEQNLEGMLGQSEFFGTMFDKASTAMIAQFGQDSPIWQMMSQQLLAAGPVEGAKLAQYIAENGLSPEMQQRLLGWDAWAGQVATDQANKNKAQGVEMAKNAMSGLNEKIKAEKERLIKMGERIGDGVVLGFKNKEGDFKRAVEGYIAAANATLGIKSPSRVFRQIGAYTAQGFNQGVEANLDTITPTVSVANPRLYAPGLTAELSQAAPVTDVRVYLGEQELTDLVDVQIARSDERAMDLVIAGRRF